MLKTAQPALTSLVLLVSISAYARPSLAAADSRASDGWQAARRLQAAALAPTDLSLQAQRGAGRKPDPIPSIGERTGGMKKIDGFFPMYWDESAGRLFVEIPKLDTDVLHSTGFATGSRLQ